MGHLNVSHLVACEGQVEQEVLIGATDEAVHVVLEAENCGVPSKRWNPSELEFSGTALNTRSRTVDPLPGMHQSISNCLIDQR